MIVSLFNSTYSAKQESYIQPILSRKTNYKITVKRLGIEYKKLYLAHETQIHTDMKLEELLTSDYAKIFDIGRIPYEKDTVMIWKPNALSFKADNLKITEGGGFMWIEEIGKFCITLYKESKTTSTSIF